MAREPPKYRERRKSSEIRDLIDALKAESAANRAELRREERGKRRRELWTIGVLALTCAVITYQLYEMIKVYDPITKQSEAVASRAINTEHTERTWISLVHSTIDGNITFDLNQSTIPVKLSLRNVGKRPAYDLSAVMISVFLSEPRDRDLKLQNSCAEVRDEKSRSRGRGVVLFPGEVVELVRDAVLGAVPADYKAQPYTPLILACITYRDALTGTAHMTGIVYALLSKPKEGELPFLPRFVRGIVPSGTFELLQWHLGNFAD